MATKKTAATLLLIDDEKLILEMYALRLEEAGYRVLAATSADVGLELFQKERPDIVFVDIVMPKHDGFWFLEKARKVSDAKLAATPIIMLTNLDDPETRRHCAELQCLYYLVKPLHTPSELAKLVADILAAKNNKPAVKIQE